MTIAEGRRATEQKSEKCAPICHMRDGVHCIYVIYMPEKSWWICVDQDNLLMLALSNFRRKLFDLQTFQNQAHIISVTGIIIYFLGTYYLYTF